MTKQGGFSNHCWLAALDSIFSFHHGFAPKRWCNLVKSFLKLSDQQVEACMPDSACDRKLDLPEALNTLMMTLELHQTCDFGFERVKEWIDARRVVAVVIGLKSLHVRLMIGYLGGDVRKVIFFDPADGIHVDRFRKEVCRPGLGPFAVCKGKVGEPEIERVVRQVKGGKVLELIDSYLADSGLETLGPGLGPTSYPELLPISSGGVRKAIEKFLGDENGSPDVDPIQISGGVRVLRVSSMAIEERPKPPAIQGRRHLLFEGGRVLAFADCEPDQGGGIVVNRLVGGEAVRDFLDALERADQVGNMPPAGEAFPHVLEIEDVQVSGLVLGAKDEADSFPFGIGRRGVLLNDRVGQANFVAAGSAL